MGDRVFPREQQSELRTRFQPRDEDKGNVSKSPAVTFRTGPGTDETLLIWTKAHSCLYGKLSFNIIRETCSYLETCAKLIDVNYGNLLLFDVSTHKLQKCCSVEFFSLLDKYCLIIGDNKYYVGGYGRMNRDSDEYVTMTYVYEFDLPVYKSKMLVARTKYGIIHHPDMNTLYAFGGEQFGTSSKFQSSEKLALGSSVWQRLPDMNRPRCHFNPCIYSSIIYLCGGGPSSAVEIYSPLSNTFTLLPEFSLGSDGSPCISIVDCDLLVVISGCHIYKWSLSDGHMTFSKNLPHQFVWSSCPPVAFARLVSTTRIMLNSIYSKHTSYWKQCLLSDAEICKPMESSVTISSEK